MNDFTNHNSTNPEPSQPGSFPDLPRTEPSNFDVLEYVRLSKKPAPQPAPASPIQSVSASLPFGELDPYVDPAELLKTPQAGQNPIELANQSLDQIEQLENAIEQLETEPMPLKSLSVEIIPANDNTVAPASDYRSHEDEAEFDEIPVARFAHQATENSNESPVTPTPPESAVPIVNPETGETTFDVRDFQNSANASIEPIPCAFEFDRELFDFHTADDLPAEEKPMFRSPASLVDNGNKELYINPVGEGQVFVAGAGDIIEVNGADGFDHIDLACFDVRCATFSDQLIRVDDELGSSFEVHYQDIDYALFADGVEVRLNPHAS